MSYNAYIQLSNDTRSLVQEQSDISMFGGGEGGEYLTLTSIAERRVGTFIPVT